MMILCSQADQAIFVYITSHNNTFATSRESVIERVSFGRFFFRYLLLIHLCIIHYYFGRLLYSLLFSYLSCFVIPDLIRDPSRILKKNWSRFAGDEYIGMNN